jgi:anti-sigma factor RsiW
MMTCEQIESLLARAGDGTLDKARHEQLNKHLARCAMCRDLLKCQTEIQELLSRRPVASVPLGFSKRVMANLGSNPVSGEPSWMDTLSWRTWTFWLTPVAATLLVTAFLGLGQDAESVGAIDFSSLVEAWVIVPESEAALGEVTLLSTEDETSAFLLDILRTSEAAVVR